MPPIGWIMPAIPEVNAKAAASDQRKRSPIEEAPILCQQHLPPGWIEPVAVKQGCLLFSRVVRGNLQPMAIDLMPGDQLWQQSQERGHREQGNLYEGRARKQKSEATPGSPARQDPFARRQHGEQNQLPAHQ